MERSNRRVHFHTGKMSVSFCGSKSALIDVSADVRREGNLSACDFKLDRLSIHDDTLICSVELVLDRTRWKLG